MKKNSHITDSVGLYVAGGKMHGVCLTRTPQGFVVDRASSASFDAEINGASAVVAVRQLIDDLAAPKECPVHISAAFNDFCTTHLNIADLPLAQMNKMAEMAYRRDVDVGEQSIVFDYEIVGESVGPAGASVPVHAFSVESSYKDALAGLLDGINRKVAFICPKFFALRNLVDSRSGATVLLVLDHQELRIAVVHDGKYIFVRTFKSGQDAFLDVVSQMVDQAVTFAELEAALDPDSDEYASQLGLEIRSAFSFITERMQKQIERALKFYADRSNSPVIEKILLYADSKVVAQNMVALLEPSYSFPVCNISLDEINNIESGDCFPAADEPRYMLAIGAASAAFKECPNLLHTHVDQLQQCKMKRAQRVISILLSVLALACFFTFALQVATLTRSRAKSRSLRKELAVYPSSITRDIVEAKAQLSRERLADLHKLSRQQVLLASFYELCNLLPAEFKLEQFQADLNESNIDNNKSGVIGRVLVQGIVTESTFQTQALLTQFLVKLSGSPLFENVDKDHLSLLESKEYMALKTEPFRISFDLVYGAEGERK